MVKTALERLDGVKEATVTFNPPQALVRFDDEKLDIVALINAVERAGFQAELLSEWTHQECCFNVLPPFQEVVEAKRPGNEIYLVMDLVEERTRNLELQLEVQRLRESLNRAGIGIAPLPNEASFPAPSR